MGNRGLAAAIGALAAILVAPSAGASVTVGSVSGTPSAFAVCPQTCTLVQERILGRQVGSPVNGTIVGWQAITTAGAARLRVLRPQIGTNAGAFVASTPYLPVASGLNTLGASVPIREFDRIGFEGTGGANVAFGGATGSRAQYFSPSPADGSTVGPSENRNQLLFVAATVEPTNTFTVGKVKNTKKGGAKISLTLPNAGTLVAGDSKILKPSSTTPNDGLVELRLKPTKKARRKLRETSKAKGSVSLTFTPEFGEASTQTLKLKLRKR